jgi:hypothetical protein
LGDCRLLSKATQATRAHTAPSSKKDKERKMKLFVSRHICRKRRSNPQQPAKAIGIQPE